MASSADILLQILTRYDGQGTKQTLSDLDKIGERATKTGKMLSARLTLPLAGIGLISLKAAADFDRAFNEVNSLLDVSDAQVEQLRSGIRAMSKELGTDLTAATKGLYNAISAGVPADNVLTFMEVASRAAIAGVTDVNTSVDLLTSVLNAYKLDASQAQAVSDQLFATVKSGKTTFPELASAIGQVAPLAASADVELSQLLGSLATLTKQGVATPQAVTQIRASITSLLNPTETLSAVYDQLSVSSGRQLIQQRGLAGALDVVRDAIGSNDQQLAKALGSIESFNGLLGLTGDNAKGAAADLDVVSNSLGSTDAAFKKIDQGSARALAKMEASIRDIRIELAESGLTDVLEEIAELVGKAADSFASLPQPVKEAVVQLAAVVALAGPMLLLSGGAARATSSILGLAAAMKTAAMASALLKFTPIGLALGALALVLPPVIAGFSDLNDEFDETARTIPEVEKEIARITKQMEQLGSSGRRQSKKSQLAYDLEELQTELAALKDPLGTAEARLAELQSRLDEVNQETGRGAAGRQKSRAELEGQIESTENLVRSLTQSEQAAKEETAAVETQTAARKSLVEVMGESARQDLDTRIRIAKALEAGHLAEAEAIEERARVEKEAQEVAKETGLAYDYVLGRLQYISSQEQNRAEKTSTGAEKELELLQAKIDGNTELVAKIEREKAIREEVQKLASDGLASEEQVLELATQLVDKRQELLGLEGQTNALAADRARLAQIEIDKANLLATAAAAREAGDNATATALEGRAKMLSSEAEELQMVLAYAERYSVTGQEALQIIRERVSAIQDEKAAIEARDAAEEANRQKWSDSASENGTDIHDLVRAANEQAGDGMSFKVVNKGNGEKEIQRMVNGRASGTLSAGELAKHTNMPAGESGSSSASASGGGASTGGIALGSELNAEQAEFVAKALDQSSASEKWYKEHRKTNELSQRLARSLDDTTKLQHNTNELLGGAIAAHEKETGKLRSDLDQLKSQFNRRLRSDLDKLKSQFNRRRV